MDIQLHVPQGIQNVDDITWRVRSKGTLEISAEGLELTEDEEAIVRYIIEKKYSVVKTGMTLHVRESTVCRTMREFYDRAQAILA